MDADGYPSQSALLRVREWPVKDAHGLMDFLHSLWMFADDGYWKQEGDTYSISTAGWSGNESLIAAMESNVEFWTMFWYEHRRGGHYVFKLRDF